MNLRLVSAASLLIGAAAPIAAQPDPAPSTPPAAARPATAEKMICHTEETIGSRLGGHRECHTAAEWRDISRRQADDLDHRLRTPHSESGG